MLRLTLSGRFSAAGADGIEFVIKSKKAKALLAYLALSPRMSRSREEIMALLWSDRGEAQARASLRQVLVGLRKDLGEEAAEALIVSNETVALEPDKVTVETSGGGEELLAGFHLPDPAFEDWLRDERLRHEDGLLPNASSNSPANPDKPSIAVLPFTNLSGNSEQEYFSDGITEDIITELSRFREFDVIARNSSFQFKDQSVNIREVGNELGARFVVEGSVRKSGHRVRVTAQLIDGHTGTHIWADRYDRQLDDIFAIQDEVTEAVVARVADRVKVAGAKVSRSRPKQSMTSYNLVLQSRPYRTQFAPESNKEAAKLLRQAIALDPKNAQAHAGLAFVLAGDYEEDWTNDPETTLQEALAEAKQAVANDDSDGYTHASLAYVLHLTRDFEKAAHEAHTALSLNPNHVNIIMTCGWISIVLGDPETAIEHIQRARQLNPYMPGFDLCTLGSAYFQAKRYQEAIDVISQVADPPNWSYIELAACYAYLNQKEKARENLDIYLERARIESVHFPGQDPIAWRDYYEKTLVLKRKEDMEHLVEGARKAGLPI